MTERQILSSLCAAMTTAVSGLGLDLTMRQFTLFMLVAEGAGPHTVRGLAERLDISRPVVSRAIDVLVAGGLVRRRPDPRDKRSVWIERTTAGGLLLRQLAQAGAPNARVNEIQRADRTSFQ